MLSAVTRVASLSRNAASASTRSVMSSDCTRTPSGTGWMTRSYQPTVPSGYTNRFSMRSVVPRARHALICR